MCADMQDNKCGWLVVQALQKASSSQQQIIKVELQGMGMLSLIRVVSAC